MISGLRLHHVGVVVADINAASAEYTRRFGYIVRSLVIHDPAQTAFVQFLQLVGDTTFLELVSPDGPKSTLTAALARGGGLNHLCFATRDIVGSHRSLRRLGMAELKPPTPAVAFEGRRVAWVMGQDHLPVELVEHFSLDPHTL